MIVWNPAEAALEDDAAAAVEALEGLATAAMAAAEAVDFAEAELEEDWGSAENGDVMEGHTVVALMLSIAC